MDSGYLHQFDTDLDDLEAWFNKNNNMDSELGYWLIYYLWLRGTQTMQSLGEMSIAIQKIAEEIDMIGYTDM